MTFSTKDLQTNVYEIGVEGDMTIFYALIYIYIYIYINQGIEINVITKTKDGTKDINNEV